MAQSSPPTISLSQYILDEMLPPLIGGCRYPHEISHPKPIPEEIRADVLLLLRRFYCSVGFHSTTLSEASETTAPARSTASASTSTTGPMTSIFSCGNQSVQGDRLMIPLGPVQRARRALMRKLTTCREDCRRRKVMCKLWHHALRDLLQTMHNPEDEALVEWAIRYDAESRGAGSSISPVSARGANFAACESPGALDVIVDQATHAFGVSQAPPLPYGSVIRETTASLLDNSNIITPLPSMVTDFAVNNIPLPLRFSTRKYTGMFPFGMRDESFGPLEYKCEWPDCSCIAEMEGLIAHFAVVHVFRFLRLPNPFRIVCLTCNKFHERASAECCPGTGPTVFEKVYGLPMSLPEEYAQGGAVRSGSEGLEPCSDQGHNSSLYLDGGASSSGNSQGCYGNYPYGSFEYSRGYSCSTTFSSSSTKIFLRNSVSLLSLPYSLLRRFARGRKYAAAFTIVIAISLFFGHKWILSKLPQLPTISHLNLPFVGIALMSFAFGFHRFVVQVHNLTGPQRRSSWLSRCALGIFNVACGRTSERIEAYELGHSRSQGA